MKNGLNGKVEIEMLINIFFGIAAFSCGYGIAKLIDNFNDPWNDGFGW